MSRPNTVERFWSKVSPSGFCWYWEGFLTDEGYGHFPLMSASSVLVHRTAYELLIGPIPKGMQLDHLCRTRNCVNPDHLEPITPSEHSLRSQRWRMNRSKCVNGHPRVPSNRLKHDRCRQCILVRTHQLRGKECAYDTFCAAPSHAYRDEVTA